MIHRQAAKSSAALLRRRPRIVNVSTQTEIIVFQD